MIIRGRISYMKTGDHRKYLEREILLIITCPNDLFISSVVFIEHLLYAESCVRNWGNK